MPQLSPQHSAQFAGFFRPGESGGERPVREEPGPNAPDARARIESGLSQHRGKTTTWGMFTNGLHLMGVRPTPANLTRVADLLDSDPGQFHALVKKARGNHVVAVDKARGQRKRGNG